jgi:hypothetical protein
VPPPEPLVPPLAAPPVPVAPPLPVAPSGMTPLLVVVTEHPTMAAEATKPEARILRQVIVIPPLWWLALDGAKPTN